MCHRVSKGSLEDTAAEESTDAVAQRYNAGLATEREHTVFESTLCYRFEAWPFFAIPTMPQSTQLYEYLAIDSGGNVSDIVFARHCCVARMLPGEVELVSQ